MKKIIGIAFAALALPLMAVTTEVDSVAAMVGTDAILKSEVNRELARMHAPDSAYSAVLNSLIDRKLILRAAAEAKMTMQDWVVESRIREIIDRSFEGDRNKLMESLSRQKVSFTEWRQRMKEDMIVAAMHWSVVEKNAVIRPAELKKRYESHPERYTEGGSVTVSVILLKPEDIGLRDTVAGALATNDFAAVAAKYSCDGHAAEGGVWKDIDPREVFKSEICDEIAEMPIGTLSRWVELDGWSFLLRKDAEVVGTPRPFLEVYDEIAEDVKRSEAVAISESWLERLRSETYIKVY